MDVTYRHYYRLSEFLLCCIGRWPFQTKFKQRLITFMVFVDIISLLTAEVFAVTNSWGDVDSTIECLQAICINLVSLSSLTACTRKTDKIELLISKMKNDWSIWTSGPELEILHDYAAQGRKLMIIYATLMFSNTFDFLATPLLPALLDLIVPLNESRDKELIIPTEYFVDPDNNYYWIALHTSITTTILMIVVVGVAVTFMAIIYHACGQLSILKFKLKSLVKEEDDNEMNIDKMQIEEEIKFCAEKHESILIFVNDIVDSFSTGYFMVLGLNMIMMSVTGVQAVMKLDEPREACRFAILTIGIMVHLFCLTIPCQHLIDNSNQLSESIYGGYWYQLSTGSQKLLLMIMMRSRKPCSFTVGKLYTFSMESFSMIVRTSMSYFTVLSSVRE